MHRPHLVHIMTALLLAGTLLVPGVTFAERQQQSAANLNEEPPCKNKKKGEGEECEKCRKQSCDKKDCTVKKLLHAAESMELVDTDEGVTIVLKGSDDRTIERMHKMAEIVRLKKELREDK